MKTNTKYLVTGSPWQNNGKYVDDQFQTLDGALIGFEAAKRDFTLQVISLWELGQEGGKRMLIDRLIK